MPIRFKSILDNPVIMTWISYVIQYGSAFLVLPAVLYFFPAADVAVWLLFMTVYGIAMLADSGFSHAIIRASAYFYHGAHALPSNLKEDISSSNAPNFAALARLLTTTRRLYILITCLAMALLISAGSLLVHNVIQLAGNRHSLWVAFGVLIVASLFRIFYVRYASFLQGLNQVAYVRRVESVIGASRILLYLATIISGSNVLGLVIVDCLYGLTLLLIARHRCQRFFRHNHCPDFRQHTFDKKIFHAMWPTSWRFGLAAYGAYLINNGCTLLVSQLNDVRLIAAYLLTIRVISIIRQIVQVPLYAHLPKLIGLYAKQDLQQLKQIAAKGIFLILMLTFVAICALCVAGNPILMFISAENRLLDTPLLILMGVTLILDLHHSAHVQIYLTSNHMPFLIPALLSGAAIVGLGYISMQYWGLWGLLWTQFFVQLAFNNWYPVKLSLKLLQWPLGTYIAALGQQMKPLFKWTSINH